MYSLDDNEWSVLGRRLPAPSRFQVSTRKAIQEQSTISRFELNDDNA
ncbi:MAG: hypothetical protein ACI8X5_004029 [Planctomycetota bacterium]|jgi:hypothetical protein